MQIRCYCCDWSLHWLFFYKNVCQLCKNIGNDTKIHQAYNSIGQMLLHHLVTTAAIGCGPKSQHTSIQPRSNPANQRDGSKVKGMNQLQVTSGLYGTNDPAPQGSLASAQSKGLNQGDRGTKRSQASKSVGPFSCSADFARPPCRLKGPTHVTCISGSAAWKLIHSIIEEPS